MSKRTRPVPRLLATAAAAVILAVTLTGCGGDMGAIASKALREASTISHDLEFASRPRDVVISEAQKSGIAKYLAQLKAAQSPSTAAAEKTLGDVLKYEKNVTAVTALADQAVSTLDTAASVVVNGSVNATSTSFKDAVQRAAHDVLHATACETVQTLLSTPEAERLKDRGADLGYSKADALQKIDEKYLFEFIYQKYLKTFIFEDVQKVLSVEEFVKSVYEQVDSIKTGITGIQQSEDAPTTTGWIFFIRYCTT